MAKPIKKECYEDEDTMCECGHEARYHDVLEHYHCSVIVNHQMIELDVGKSEDGWIVEDSWGEFDGGIIKTFKKCEDAIMFAFETLFKKYPDAQMLYGQIPREVEKRVEDLYVRTKPNPAIK